MQYCVQRRYLKRTLYDTSIQSMRCSLNFKNAYYTFERIIVFGFPLKRQYYYNIILLLSPPLVVVTLCRHTHTHSHSSRVSKAIFQRNVLIPPLDKFIFNASTPSFTRVRAETIRYLQIFHLPPKIVKVDCRGVYVQTHSL